jgi:diguanylate cyclase (GGDEF)-like protein/PAS domain S-box-containing protein
MGVQESGARYNVKKYRPHLFVVCALAIVALTGLQGGLRNALTDLNFAWTPRQASGAVVVIAIDSHSIEKIGVWPWPRRLHAELLGKLESAGVRDIVFDVDFSAPSDPAADQAFAEALAAAGGSVVLPSFKQPGGSGKNATAVHINRPLKEFVDHAWSAVVNVAVERDGLVRRYPFGEKLDGEFLPSMGAVLAGQYATTRDPFLIDYSIRTASIPVLSYVDVLRGDDETLKKLRDRRVVIGGTALELGDRFSVPNGAVVSGPLLQVLAAESILGNRVLRPTSGLVTLGGLCVIALVMLLSWRRLAAGVRAMVLVGTALAIEAIAVLVQAKLPLVLDTSLFLTAIAVYLAAIALDEIDFRGLLSRIAERRFQRIAMSLGDGLVCADANRRITVWNPGAVAIFGYPRDEMIGKPFDTVYAASDDTANRSFSIGDVPHHLLQLPGGKVMELRGRRKNGELFPLEACFSAWQGADGFQYGAILRDISVRKREAERIRYLAEYDSLTGLANRNTLHARLADMVSQASTEPGEIGLLVLGLEKFQQINDMLGQACGDLVLRAVSDRLNAEVAEAGLVARLSGDEFAIAISGAEAAQAITALSERILLAFDTPLPAGSRQHRIKVSIGTALFPRDAGTADELLGNGHLAMYRAKATRRGGHLQFERAIRDELEARLTLDAELARAVERNEFELFYQPQVSLPDASLIGAEALIRWRHPTRGLVPPAEFMPVVNASSISDSIATWVMKTACTQARVWEQAGHRVRVGINLSPSQMQSGDLASSVKEALEITGLTPSLLELEVTEDILVVDVHRALEIFLAIQDLGVRMVFDDFGTGYASLSYLKKFPLDGLKIDRSFVMEMRADSDDAAIVGATIGLSKQLGLTVIAEGIENRATADLLASMGCQEGQGYYFGRPIPAAEFEQKFLLDAATPSCVPASERTASAALIPA